MSRVFRVFLAGLLALLPLTVTIFVTSWVIDFLNGYFGPNAFFGRALVSLGLSVGVSETAPYVIGLLALVIGIYLLGLIVETSVGSWIRRLFEALIARIPLVSNVYDMSKRFTSIMDTKDGNSLKGMSPVWCFFGGEPGAAVLGLMPSATPVVIGGTEYVGVLVPSAPVPVGGALVYVPKSWVKPAEGGVDDLMSVYVSMGVTPPGAIKRA
jgi:uncharacterized membrane protein